MRARRGAHARAPQARARARPVPFLGVSARVWIFLNSDLLGKMMAFAPRVSFLISKHFLSKQLAVLALSLAESKEIGLYTPWARGLGG